eukprot:TRINITY_DN4212_c0_g1_i2.p1 TRINITY_DN4212_c0_g1~~TRINITY_DN4212_c0_g1_i2.p1  ORF type:complete len:366 (-),score=97.44 TRINITY_DN4212_c0_g1_i2:122-1219(-)
MKKTPVQDIRMGIWRSDYMLHAEEDGQFGIRQVEINTIASSFSNLSSFTSQLHRFLISKLNIEEYSIEKIPENPTLKTLPDVFAKAFALFGNPNAVVMMIIHPNENNAFDQRWLEYNLWEMHKIRMIRRSLKDVADSGRLDSQGNLHVGEFPIAITYYRAGYTPDDYPTQTEWEARWTIEKSTCVKTPNISEHLAGTKKVQQVLALPGVLERFVKDQNDCKELRSSFAGLYSLTAGDPGVDQIVRQAIENPMKFVMKPQREGGGNNIYGKNLENSLKTLGKEEISSYILMDRILPPEIPMIVLREGEISRAAGVSELGIYGIFLSSGGKLVENSAGGHLLRTKVSHVEDGGVAAGVAVLDSPYLI